MVVAGTTTRYSFDLQPGDVWWCTADPGDASMKHPGSSSGLYLEDSRYILPPAGLKQHLLRLLDKDCCRPWLSSCNRAVSSSTMRRRCLASLELWMTGQSGIFAGWITGHTYLAYGPLLCNATCVIYEGVPSYPTPARCWEIVEKFKVSSRICELGLRLSALSAIGL